MRLLEPRPVYFGKARDALVLEESERTLWQRLATESGNRIRYEPRDPVDAVRLVDWLERTGSPPR